MALTPHNMGVALLGAFLGTMVGVLPGIGPFGAMALLLSSPSGCRARRSSCAPDLLRLQYRFHQSILPTSRRTTRVTTLDGFKMAKRGRGGARCSSRGGSFSPHHRLVLMSFWPAPWPRGPEVRPAGVLPIAVFGLVVLSQLSGQGFLKSFLMVGVGLMLGTVGLDVITGMPRLDFGSVALQKGIDFVPVAMGLFGIAEVLETIEQGFGQKAEVIKVKLRELLPNREESRRSLGPSLRGSVLGFLVGLIPGPAAVISTFMSYTLERKISKNPEEFGHGAPEGVSGPESANNASAVGAFVPLLSLGIPFAPPTALLLSAMLIHGVTPGPLLLKDNPDIFWGVIASMYVGNFMLLVLNLPLVGLFVRVLRAPLQLLMPVVLLLCLVGAFAINNTVADIWIMVLSGLAGYVLRKLDYPLAPLVLALVIGPVLEDSLRQSLLMSLGSFGVFWERPLCSSLLAITALVVVIPPFMKQLRARHAFGRSPQNPSSTGAA